VRSKAVMRNKEMKDIKRWINKALKFETPTAINICVK
jgi:hypothetical protein